MRGLLAVATIFQYLMGVTGVPLLLGEILRPLESAQWLFLLGVALITGLTFAKFARPTARVMWSDNAVIVLPQPLSPTIAKVSARRIAKETSSTALTTPRRVKR